jgi:hypothetical protein
MRGIRAEVDLVMTLRDIERLGEFPGAGAKPPNVFDVAAFSHQREATRWFNRSDEDDTFARAALDEDVEHPVGAVCEVNISCARFVPLHKGARARSLEGVTGFVALDQIRLRLDDDSRASFPDELRANEVFGAAQRVNLKKIYRQHFLKLAELVAASLALLSSV